MTELLPGSSAQAAIVFAETGELFGLVFVHQRIDHLSEVALHDLVELVEFQDDTMVCSPDRRNRYIENNFSDEKNLEFYNRIYCKQKLTNKF